MIRPPRMAFCYVTEITLTLRAAEKTLKAQPPRKARPAKAHGSPSLKMCASYFCRDGGSDNSELGWLTVWKDRIANVVGELFRSGDAPDSARKSWCLPSSFYEVWFRTAELARPLASALFSRRTWEMEKLIERANLRQIKFRE